MNIFGVIFIAVTIPPLIAILWMVTFAIWREIFKRKDV